MTENDINKKIKRLQRLGDVLQSELQELLTAVNAPVENQKEKNISSGVAKYLKLIDKR